MFPMDPMGNQSGGSNIPIDGGMDAASFDDGGYYFVDFGPIFAQEVEKVLRYRRSGLFAELMFWQDEYRF